MTENFRIPYTAHIAFLLNSVALWSLLIPGAVKPSPTIAFALGASPAWNALTLLLKWLVFLILQCQCHLFQDASSDYALLLISFFARIAPFLSISPLDSKTRDSGTICPVHCYIPNT